MTDAERDAFHSAVVRMGNTPIGDGDLSQYDVFVDNHNPFIARQAHGGAGFYGYHRELLLRYRHCNTSVFLYM